ncbi:hypothetical protein MYP_3334 [Sporocytophaga myxococcoides]|uniref:Uncharacterized protein n=1 Tax=Sporocytophaga myxococcoides TaxID=153721 RepID=A0A098LGL3_9BACT|nr:hypothetical protein MYP_3334 [Sporocytophaga myxococcoides]
MVCSTPLKFKVAEFVNIAGRGFSLLSEHEHNKIVSAVRTTENENIFLCIVTSNYVFILI